MPCSIGPLPDHAADPLAPEHSPGGWCLHLLQIAITPLLQWPQPHAELTETGRSFFKTRKLSSTILKLKMSAMRTSSSGKTTPAGQRPCFMHKLGLQPVQSVARGPLHVWHRAEHGMHARASSA